MDLNSIKINPITNEEEFNKASEIIDSLIDADLIEDPIERKKALDILEAITILAVEYEKKHYPIPKPTLVDEIKESIEQLHLSPKAVAARKKMLFLLKELHAEAKINGLTDEVISELLANEEHF